MSTIKINLILFGIGNVGSTLIKQVLESKQFFLEKRNIDLCFPVIANSKLALFEKQDFTKHWKKDFKNEAIPFTVQDIFEFVEQNELENCIAIDATASNTILENYTVLFQNGFHIVAANKKANTQTIDFYNYIRKIAKKHDVIFLYEANVGAGLPVVQTINDLHFSGEKIKKIKGVFSGTLSYIFNRFSIEEKSFSKILIEAEQNGFTEPDSREDLSGNDVARKLLILAREIETEIELADVKVTSLLLPNLNETHSEEAYALSKTAFDKPFEIAKITQLENHVLRYIGEFDVESNNLEVKLVSVSKFSPLGQLQGADNLVEIYTESYGEIPIVIQGAGAGLAVTARGVLSDVLKVAEKIKIKNYLLV